MSADVLDIYDTEVAKIGEVLAVLRDRAQSARNYNAFEREITERFAAIGFTVAVNWYTYALGDEPQDGAMPEITVTGRTAPGFRFDPDRQVHEAVSNVLGLPGQEGWIKTGDAMKRMRESNGG